MPLSCRFIWMGVPRRFRGASLLNMPVPKNMGVPRIWVSQRSNLGVGVPNASSPEHACPKEHGCPKDMGVPTEKYPNGEIWMGVPTWGCGGWVSQLGGVPTWGCPNLGVGVPNASPNVANVGVPNVGVQNVAANVGVPNVAVPNVAVPTEWVSGWDCGLAFDRGSGRGYIAGGPLDAWVAKLVDAPDSKSGRGDPVRVRVSPQAPTRHEAVRVSRGRALPQCECEDEREMVPW